MNEKFLHFLWRNRLFPQMLTSVDGQKIEVLNVGFPSVDAGPDFTGARLKINNRFWAGAVELHVKSSDWYKHGHGDNPVFEGVILHVVMEYDKPVYRKNGELIPTVVIKPTEALIARYKDLASSKEKVKCSAYHQDIDAVVVAGWLDNLLFERLIARRVEIVQQLHNNNEDWEETLYQRIARSLGMRVNDEPFEMLARSLPYKILKRYKDNRQVLEALLYGQAGFLEDNIEDEYFLKLKRDYHHYAIKHKLKPLNKKIWKFMRLRPYNYPTIRISHLAYIISQTDHLFSYILEAEDVKRTKELFKAKTTDYWDTHFRFGDEGKFIRKDLGPKAIDNILINAVIPVLFSYALYMHDNVLKDRAFAFMKTIDFENNYITRLFRKLHVNKPSAADSQAFIQLYKHYCLENRCLECRLGAFIIEKGGKQ